MIVDFKSEVITRMGSKKLSCRFQIKHDREVLHTKLLELDLIPVPERVASRGYYTLKFLKGAELESLSRMTSWFLRDQASIGTVRRLLSEFQFHGWADYKDVYLEPKLNLGLIYLGSGNHYYTDDYLLLTKAGELDSERIEIVGGRIEDLPGSLARPLDLRPGESYQIATVLKKLKAVDSWFGSNSKELLLSDIESSSRTFLSSPPEKSKVDLILQSLHRNPGAATMLNDLCSLYDSCGYDTSSIRESAKKRLSTYVAQLHMNDRTQLISVFYDYR